MLFKLALKELSFDRMMSCCQVAAIACILAPLLLLFSLRYGVLQEMEHRLLNDPKILSLSLDTSYRLDNNFFAKLRARPEVGYVIPEISALNALVDVKVPGGVARVSVMATSLGDPIVTGSGIPYSQPQDELRMGRTAAPPPAPAPASAHVTAVPTSPAMAPAPEAVPEPTPTPMPTSAPALEVAPALTSDFAVPTDNAASEGTIPEEPEVMFNVPSDEEEEEELVVTGAGNAADADVDLSSDLPVPLMSIEGGEESAPQEVAPASESVVVSMAPKTEPEPEVAAHAPEMAAPVAISDGAPVAAEGAPLVAPVAAEGAAVAAVEPASEVYECFITQKAFKKYQLSEGDTVTLMVRRIKNKQNQVSRLPLKIRGVILDRFVNDDFILLPPAVVTALDDYRNGYEPDIFSDGSAQPEGTRHYAKFRLYAKDLNSVIPLYYHLAQHQLNVRSKVQEIENLQAVDRVLNFVFGVVALVSLVGGAIALGGLMLSSLKAKKRNLVLLRLMGQAPHDTYLLVLLEAVIIAVCGFALALGLYYGGSMIFNQYFKQVVVGMVISELIWQHIVCFFAATILVLGLTALWTAKYLLLRVHIADILREA